MDYLKGKSQKQYYIPSITAPDVWQVPISPVRRLKKGGGVEQGSSKIYLTGLNNQRSTYIFDLYVYLHMHL